MDGISQPQSNLSVTTFFFSVPIEALERRTITEVGDQQGPAVALAKAGLPFRHQRWELCARWTGSRPESRKPSPILVLQAHAPVRINLGQVGTLNLTSPGHGTGTREIYRARGLILARSPPEYGL